MKSLYRASYIIIFIFSAIYVFNHEKYSKRVEIIDGYCLNFSVERGKNVDFFIVPKISHKRGIICIYNSRDSIVDSLILELKTGQIITDSLSYEKGFDLSQKITYNTKKLKSGLYFLGQKVPFIVKDSEIKNSITLIFPYANFHSWSNSGGKSFSNDNSSYKKAARKLSLRRNPYLSNNPKFFINWLDSVLQGKNFNIISDLDLENKENIKNTELLLFFGNMGFGTKKQNVNILNFNDHGGKILAICSRLMNYEMKIDNENYTIENITIKDTISQNIVENDLSYLSVINPFWNTFACDFRYSYTIDNPKKSNSGYTIIQSQHKIFDGILSSFIPFENSFGASLPVEDINFKRYPKPDNSKNKFYNFNILAFDYFILYNRQSITGIFEIKRTANSGSIIVIGNEKWVFQEQLPRAPFGKITFNCIQYLKSQ